MMANINSLVPLPLIAAILKTGQSSPIHQQSPDNVHLFLHTAIYQFYSAPANAAYWPNHHSISQLHE